MTQTIDYQALWFGAIKIATAGTYKTQEAYYDRVIKIFEDSLPSDYPGKDGLVARVSRIIYGYDK